jgi:hypothetical protein
MRKSVKNAAYAAGKKLGLTGSALALFVSNAMAAVPATVTTALTDAGTDSLAVAGMVFAAVVGIFAFTLMRKPLH